jgi:sulfur relay (sulfurtransferase) complex TusBCD TusD component (DsrE family)
MAIKDNTVLVFKTNGMGNTEDQQLKEKLAKTFLTLTAQMDPLPKIICLYTDGVKLACEGSPVLEELTLLEQKGVHLVLCQTCLNAFNMLDLVKVGIVGGMTDIITAMWHADKVIMV